MFRLKHHVGMFASDKIFFQYKMAMITLTIMMMATTMIVRIMRGGQWHHIILGTNQNSSPITLTALIIGTNHKTDFDGICDFFLSIYAMKGNTLSLICFFSSTSSFYIILILLRWGFPSWYAALFNHDSC